LRWLVQIDKDNAAAGGEGISTQHHEEAALEVGAELQRLQRAPMPIAAKGPTDSLQAVKKIVDDAQALWDSMAAAQRRDIGSTPEPFLQHCKQVAEAAQALAETRADLAALAV
jgi:gamma-glutamyl:cysteine ligase YbdK (ATP-grasp superfamily)